MIPASYAIPSAVILVVSGAVACFGGYRLFRVVLGVYGFILGAVVVSSLMGTENMWALAMATAVGGLIGAGLMIAAYFIGVGLVGAGLASLGVHMVWRAVGGDPPTALLVIMAVLGALGALKVARYVVVIGTALGGAWTLIVGGLALAGDRVEGISITPDNIWTVYAAGPLPGNWSMIGGWVVLAMVGAAAQLATTSKGGKSKRIGGRRR